MTVNVVTLKGSLVPGWSQSSRRFLRSDHSALFSQAALCVLFTQHPEVAMQHHCEATAFTSLT